MKSLGRLQLRDTAHSRKLSNRRWWVGQGSNSELFSAKKSRFEGQSLLVLRALGTSAGNRVVVVVV